MAHVQYCDAARGVVDLVDHAIDSETKPVGALGADDLADACGARGNAELRDAVQQPAADPDGKTPQVLLD